MSWSNDLDILGKPITTKTGNTIPWDANLNQIKSLAGGDLVDFGRIMGEIHISEKYFAP